MMQQNQGGQVPANVAAAAIKVSSLSSDGARSPASPKPKPPPTKINKTVVKPIQVCEPCEKHISLY